ncbi:MAG TPA: small multi-drug export protein [Aggregatilineales bacterium]|nr:small multi-drug export protein [Aggregatilineales bacterium]
MEYLLKAGSAWFVGFFPLAEIYIAVPSAVALGLDDVSVILWTVLGNFTPALLINFLYQQIMRIPRVASWLKRLISDKVQAQINRFGMWFVLLATPWTGIWAMAVAAKILRIRTGQFLLAAFVSILVYAVVILVLIRAGLATFD